MLLRCAAATALVACAPPPPPPAQCGFVGDAALPVELLPIALDGQGVPRALRSNDAVLLQKPPQGGYVIYAGAAARNLDGCKAQVSASLIDPASGLPVTNLDVRRADFTVEASGFFWPANGYVQTPNIPACPDALHQGVNGRTAILRVEVKDAGQRSARVEVQVVATCAPGDAACACLCGPDPGSC